MAKPAPTPPAIESFSWFGSLKRYGKGKRHDLASVRKSIARERRRHFFDTADRLTEAPDGNGTDPAFPAEASPVR